MLETDALICSFVVNACTYGTSSTKVLGNAVDSNRLFRKRILMRLHHRDLMTLHDHKYHPVALLIPVPPHAEAIPLVA